MKPWGRAAAALHEAATNSSPSSRQGRTPSLRLLVYNFLTSQSEEINKINGFCALTQLQNPFTLASMFNAWAVMPGGAPALSGRRGSFGLKPQPRRRRQQQQARRRGTAARSQTLAWTCWELTRGSV